MEEEILDRLEEGIIVFNKENEIQFCNKNILDKLGYTLDQVIYSDVRKIMSVYSDYLNRDEICLQSIDDKKITARGEIVLHKWQGKEVYWGIIKSYADKGYTIKELEMIIENMPYATWICDQNGKYKYVNYNTITMAKKIKKDSLTKADFMSQNAKESWENITYPGIFEKDDSLLRKGNIISEERKADSGTQQIKYYLIKIPIMDEKGAYNGFIGIAQYDLFDMNAREVIGKNDLSLSNKYINSEINKIDEIEDFFRFNELVKHMLEAEMVTIFKYHERTDELRGILRMGNVSDDLLDIKEITMNQKKYKEIQEKKRVWTLDEFEQTISCKGIGELRDNRVKYLYLNYIKYRNEVVGAVIATYRDDFRNYMMERELQKNLCKHIANLFKNKQLSLEIHSEFEKRKMAEEELKIYLDLAVDFIFTLNEEGKALKWNDAWHVLLGWNNEDLRTMVYRELSHSEDYQKNKEIIRKIYENGEVEHLTNRYRHKNGTYRLLECTIKFDKERQCYFGIAKDITEERKIEEERKAYKEALKLETLKTEFLANISHELKTPLNILYSMIQLTELELKRVENQYAGAIDFEMLGRYKKVSNQNVYRLLRLINNITDISRIGAGYYKAKLVNCNIIQVVEDITMSVVEYVKNKKLNIIFDTEEEELMMACDPEKMERIMLNLLSNAVKYTNEGDNIWVKIKSRDNNLQIVIADNGIGIPKDKQETIFERFAQVDTSFTRKCEGSGIGLALVKSLVEQQKGSIKVQSVLGRGSLFTVTLPIYLVEETREIGRADENTYIEKCKVEFSDIYDI